MAVLWSKASTSYCSWLLGVWLLSTIPSPTVGCMAGTQDIDKLLTCGDCPDGNDTVWCLNETARVVQNPWTGCFSYGEGNFNKTGRNTLLFDELEVTAKGDLWIPADSVTNNLQKAIFNCTNIGEAGELCQDEFEFLIFVIDVRSPPTLAGVGNLENGPINVSSIIGRQEILCFKVQSPDTNGTVYWQVGNSSGETVPATHISSENCTDCNCVKEMLLPAIMESQPRLPHYSAFFAPVFEFSGSFGCLPDVSNRVLSFLLIDAITPTDSGGYALTIFSITNTKNEDGLQYSVDASYATVAPEFHHPSVSETTIINTNSNHSFLCNATTSRGAVLLWEIALTQQVFEPEEALDRALDETTLRGLCRERSSDRFAVSLGQREVIVEEFEALVWVQQTALVICNAHTNFSARYSCKASDSDKSRSLVLDVVPPSLGPQGGTVSTWIIALAVVFSLIALAAVAGIVWMTLRFRLKKKPDIIGATNPIVFEFLRPEFPRDRPEFPRDRLELKEVIGEGQFGQVWRALAEGICPDSSRNVVAVKTLKPNARPSDRNDLTDELNIMQTMEPHPNIVNFLGMCSETDSEPLLILMEFAVYGSLKSYLAECRTNSNPAGLQAPPQATPQHLASLAGSAVRLCDYHQQQLHHLQGLGDYPNLHSSDSSSQLSLADPVSLVQARRLLRLLRSDYSYRYYSDDYHSREDQAEDREARDNPALAHNQQALKHLSSNYDRLAPLVAGGRCAYRPCLEDPYHCPPPRGGECDDIDYYNQSEGECECMHLPVSPHSSVSLSQEEVEPREKTPPLVRPMYTNVVSKQEALTHPHSPRRTSREENSPLFSPSYSNVPEPEAERQSMVSLPDGYIYSPSSMCAYCSLQVGATVGAQQEVELGVEQEAGPRERQAVEESESPPLAGGGLAYFDVLDMGLQIARGMEHLEKMKCIHRDLAARNVLLAEGFLLKIGDFGLSRDLHNRDYYRKFTPGRLPVRWMAMESLQQRIHNYKSDVWSFGVVLWEILTFGGTPYGRSPVAHSCEGLIKYLQGGRRLPKPLGPNCTDELYNLMLQCWHDDPNARPSFTELISTFDNFLSLAHGYLRVNPDAEGQTAGQEAPSPGPPSASDTTTLALSTTETVPSENSSATFYVLQNGRPQPYLEPKPSVTSGQPLLNQNTSLTTNSPSPPATSPDSTTHLLPSSPPTGTLLPASPTSKPGGTHHKQIQIASTTLQLHPDCLETEV